MNEVMFEVFDNIINTEARFDNCVEIFEINKGIIEQEQNL